MDSKRSKYIVITFCLVPSPPLQAFLPFKNTETGGCSTSEPQRSLLHSSDDYQEEKAQ